MKTHSIHLLALGLQDHGAVLPEPLASMLAAGTVQITHCDSLHAAAAILVQIEAHFAAILIDPSLFLRRELRSLSVVKRHSALPIWMLPINGRCALQQELLGAEALPWSDASKTLTQLLLFAPTPLPHEGNRGNPQVAKIFEIHSAHSVSSPSAAFPAPLHPPVASDEAPSAAHNDGDLTPQKLSEIHIAPALVASYDETISQPSLSENELRALLGASE